MAKSAYDHVKEWRKRNPEARKEEARRYRAKYPEKARATAMRWLDRNRDKARLRGAESARNKRKADPEGQRRRVAKFKAKREEERVKIAGRPRPSVCDICHGNHHLGIVFDHCHESGRFRGWLCDRCNKVLGLVADDPSLLRKMATYVEKANGKANRKKEECTPIERLCRTEQVVSGAG